MNHLPFCRALAVVACALFTTPALAATAAQAPSPAAATAEARKLMGDRKFEEALAVLRPLARSPAAHANVRFMLGLAAVEVSQKPDIPDARRDALLDEAIAAFHAMLFRRPELVRVRLELARAFFLKGEDKLARRHFEQVLAGKPPAARGAERQPFPQPDPGAQALEPAPRHGARARYQYRRRLGRADHLHPGPPLPPRRRTS